MEWPVESCAWAGRAGALVRIPEVTHDSFTYSGGPSMVTRRTVSGGNRAQRIVEPRSWTLSFTAVTLADMAGLVALQGGGFGPGPFQWVTPDMQAGNLLTPAAAAISGWGAWSSAGPRVMGDVVLAGSVNGSGSATIPGTVPAMAGVPVTGSAYVTAGATVAVQLLNLTGGVIGSVTSSAAVGTGLVRVSSTVVSASAAVVAARLVVNGATTIAGPAITWTPAVAPYSPGLGVDGVVFFGAEPKSRYGGLEGPVIDIVATVEEVR